MYAEGLLGILHISQSSQESISFASCWKKKHHDRQVNKETKASGPLSSLLSQSVHVLWLLISAIQYRIKTGWDTAH